MEGVLAIVYLILAALSSLFDGPSVRTDTDRVETIITKGGDYLESVVLQDIANLDEVEFIESRRYGYMYADDYEPYNQLRAERERQRFGLYVITGGDDDDCDSADDFEW